MKTIAIHNKSHYITGLVAALDACRYPVLWWNPDVKPIFDMMEEKKPNLLLCHSEDINIDMVNALEEYNPKIVLIGFSSAYIKPDLLCIPEEKIKNPKIVEYLEKSGLKIMTINKRANVAQYNGGKFCEEYSSDILYLSREQPSNNTITILKYLINNTNYRVKICGNYQLPFAEYLGRIDLSTALDMMKSSKVVLDFDGDIAWNCAAMNVPCLSNRDDNCAIYYQNTDDLMDKINSILVSSSQPNLIEELYNKKMTYHHLLAQILENINLTTEASDITSKIPQLKNN